jgi:hypothetical protein
VPASWNYRDTRSGYRGRTHISVVYALLVLLATADLCASAQVCVRKKRKCPTGAATNASARELRSMTSHFIGQCSRWWQDTSLHGCSPDKFTLGCSSAEHAYWPWLLSSRKFVRFVADEAWCESVGVTYRRRTSRNRSGSARVSLRAASGAKRNRAQQGRECGAGE